ncbi:uncharacterized protein PGTG_12010 [Puccinia graminis f. sp. tritici CRL 75-36-700-3]|uniref:Uncharacterized protein n=1 Tax=Puccinia graminis f. sp. tritici (strain CRL 75-36-700-3 / race SCCL) TaxID=418459 RepID=E3KP29_PUCGT|nr:uncharacterized protein PGTG_12010 [Puccinia graminis f. sp. tritici CRL 75-36-700-3]EFP86054.1 hypothetical protein PGTG_12010 [Puccinia graminis f. sp. tritici CRL 75-36-700-3]
MADAGAGSSDGKMVKIKPQDKSLRFDGNNVERFLSDYQLAARLDGASNSDMAQQVRFFVRGEEVKDVLETLDGFEPPNWSLLKVAMLAHWGKVDIAKFTTQDLESLVQEWIDKGGVSSLVNYQDFRKGWEPIQSYLLRKAHIDSLEEIQTLFYRLFSTAVQERIRDQLIKDKTMITTLDNRFKLPTFDVLKKAVDKVMKGQTALTFEDSRSSNPVLTSLFKQSNDIMNKMETDRRPKEAPVSAKAPATIDEISKMLQSFEQRLEKKFSASAAPPSSSVPPAPQGPIVCYYCHREGHGIARCFELQKDKSENLVDQQGNNFFLPNGALIPFDLSRPIQHVVASYQPKTSSSTATTELRTTCGTLEPWYPPAISSQSFSGAYQSDPARKRHEAPKPYKAPVTPPMAARRPARKATVPSAGVEAEDMDVEAELFDRTPAELGADSSAEEPPSLAEPEPVPASLPPKSTSAPPKVRFECGITKDHPNAVDGVLKKISDLTVPGLSVSELLAISPSVAEGMKKWVSRRRVEVGPEELKVSSGTLAEGPETNGQLGDLRLYSCPLGYLPCLVGEDESTAAPLVDSGSQLNLISDAMDNKFNISP